jgi:hypothetical protein
MFSGKELELTGNPASNRSKKYAEKTSSPDSEFLKEFLMQDRFVIR